MKKDKILKRHSDRKDLTGEYKFGDAGQIILLFIFLSVWITDTFVFRYSTLNLRHITFFVRLPISLIILFFSGYLAHSGLNTIFRQIRDEAVVVTNGVFSLVRHPIYLGSILFYLGLIILFPSGISLFVLTITAVFYYLISKHEEKLLVQRFGKEYERYQKNVPMLIPFS